MLRGDKYVCTSLDIQRNNRLLFMVWLTALRRISFSFEQLKEWYNGHYTFDSIRLYNPWSIGSSLTDGKLGPYWVESSNQSFHPFCLV